MLSSCPKCDAIPGERHEFMCDWARCKDTGEQMIQCIGLMPSLSGKDSLHPGECIPSMFTGYYAGEYFAIKQKWYCKLVSGQGWVPCDIDDPDASPDLNRAWSEGTWDSELEELTA